MLFKSTTLIVCSLAAMLFGNASGRIRADDVILVIGAPGEPIYQQQFNDWGKKLSDATKASGISTVVIGRDDQGKEVLVSDKDRLREAIETLSAEAMVGETSDKDANPATAWVFFIGHGTFGNGTAKFNLRGPDVSAKEFATWLVGVKRPVVVVNCASSSGPFVNRLSGSDRVVVTATKSGDEQEFARFGKYLVEAMTSGEGDLDHDDEVSILEAFVKAAAETGAFYRTEGRIATEHALIDDNGDGLGTPADAFVGLEVPESKVAEDGKPDGDRAWQFTLIPAVSAIALTPEQIQQRGEIESQLRDLRKRKDSIGKEDYWQKIESLMLQQAKLYESASK